jgi:FdhD protein
MRNGVQYLDILQIEKNSHSILSDSIIEEVTVDLFLNNTRCTTIACTGNHIEEMAIGFLRSQGIIRTSEDLLRFDVSPGGDQIHIVTRGAAELPTFHESIVSSGGREVTPEKREEPIQSSITITAKHVLKLMKDLMGMSSLHKVTHGTHCSAMADEQKIVVAREDIGRHNTVDMLSGYAFLKGIDCSDKAILTTGRVSSEIINKVWKLGAPIIISHSAATSRAITLAQDAGITIIGYVRNARMKVYSRQERVIV